MNNMNFHLQNQMRNTVKNFEGFEGCGSRNSDSTHGSGNGIVDIMGVSPEKSFPLYYEKSNNENASRSLGNIHGTNPLNTTFFSPENVEVLQQSVRKGVYDRSNGRHVIGKQSEIELKIIMRSVYLQYAKNISTNIAQQINVLNRLVINICVPKILTNIEQYIGYKRDISGLPKPLPRAQSVSSAGTKSTRMTRF